MALTYAIPDVHGRLDLLDAAIDLIVEHARGNRATIVTLGDYIDRGPDSFHVIERLMDWRSDVLTLVSLKGNHEAMMWQVCNNLAELSWWTGNGGEQTLKSYGHSPEHTFNPSLVPRAHLEWISGLSLMHVDQHRIFVHAAINPKIPLEQQTEEVLLWKRYSPGFDLGHGKRHVVHGHHANSAAPIVTRGKTNLDGMAWKTGRLVVGVFNDDHPGGASRFMEIIGPPGSN